MILVFIHRSIKTRIETRIGINPLPSLRKFLYIDPLKQGLKLSAILNEPDVIPQFLYIDPLKQGLKHRKLEDREDKRPSFYT